MPESHADIAAITWTVPECPFAVECVPRILDDIRLAIVDAFFSLPRGGAEIGGILLGRYSDDRVTVAEYLALECEHAMGPSFILSARDEAQLQQLLDQPHPAGLRPVGWYHSHTRSEIFLSDADQLIHKRFFPEPWQVALVFKPHTFQPMRCGFFFRAADGVMRADSSYREFVLEAMPLRPMPSGVAPPMLANTPPSLQREGQGLSPVIDVSTSEAVVPRLEMAAPEPPPHPAPVIVPVAAPLVDAPTFGVVAEQRSWQWLKVVLALAVILGSVAFGFQTRQIWLPKLMNTGTPAATPAPSPVASLALTATDTEGQLQIAWDRTSPIVQHGTSAVLNITDGGPIPREIHLDAEHLRNGSFTYGRESTQVNVTLAVTQPTGPIVRSAVGYVGKLPAPPAVDPAELTKLKADLAAETEKNKKIEKLLADQSLLVSQATRMKADLATQTERVKKLQKDLAAAQNDLKQQQRKRLGAQDPGK